MTRGLKIAHSAAIAVGVSIAILWRLAFVVLAVAGGWWLINNYL